MLEEEGTVDDFDLVDGNVLLTGLYGMRPQEVYRYGLEDRKLIQVSRFNEEVLTANMWRSRSVSPLSMTEWRSTAGF